MANYFCTKDKNIIRFVDRETNKFWTLDVNTGIFLSMSGNAIRRFPKGFGKYLDDIRYEDVHPVVQLMARIRNCTYEYGLNNYYTLSNPAEYTHFASLFQTVDKLASLGYRPDRWHTPSVNELEFVSENFKAFAKWFNDHPDQFLDNFMEECSFQIFCQKNNINMEHLSAESIGFIRHYIMRAGYNCPFLTDTKYIPYTLYFLGRGVIDFCGEGMAAQKINDLYFYCDTMDKMPEKSDFYRQYVDAKKTYEMNKAAYDVARLAKNYAEHRNALAYENDTFKVIIPATVEEFAAEADAQRNCVYSMYLSRCLDQKTHVVFIRRKNSVKTPYITCEVDKRGHIVQYLAKYNQRVHADDALAFYAEYKDWIAKNW